MRSALRNLNSWRSAISRRACERADSFWSVRWTRNSSTSIARTAAAATGAPRREVREPRQIAAVRLDGRGRQLPLHPHVVEELLDGQIESRGHGAMVGPPDRLRKLLLFLTRTAGDEARPP